MVQNVAIIYADERVVMPNHTGTGFNEDVMKTFSWYPALAVSLKEHNRFLNAAFYFFASYI